MSEQDKGQKPHQFKQGVDMIHPVSNVGDVTVCLLKRELEHSDENYYSGMQETKKYTTPALDMVAVVGARELSKGIKAELNQITITGVKVHELVMDGRLSMVDLTDKKLLNDRLDVIEGLSSFDKYQIKKYRQTAYDLLVVRDALEKKKAMADKLDTPLKEHLKTNEFFDLQQKKTNDIFKEYFKLSDNDVLRNVNPAGLSEKKLKKLLASGKRNEFGQSDYSAIRLVSRQMKYRESRIRIGKLLNIRKRVESLRYYAERTESTTSEGIRQISEAAHIIHGAWAVGKFGLKSGIVAASFAGKYSGASFLLHKLNQIRREKTNQINNMAKAAVKNSKPYKVAADKKTKIERRITDTKNTINQKMNQNSAVQKYKTAQKKAKEKAKKAAKKANQTKAAAKAAGRHVKQGADIVMSPMRFVGKMLRKITGFFGKIRLELMAAGGIVIAVFLIVIVLVNSILSVCNTQATASVSLILTEDENFVADMNSVLQAKAEAKKEEAKKLAKGTPKSPEVLARHYISRYGHPNESGKYKGGSKITYLDGDGNVILNGMNNIKECIAMAYVIMEGDFDTDTKARDALINDLWDIMNPDVTYKESDIYICSNGCDSFTYTCNNDTDYKKIDEYKEEGVGIYGEIVSYNEYGDKYTVTCKGCKDENDETYYHPLQTGSGEAVPATGCENNSVVYECDGHNVKVCYGHRDIEVYLTVNTLDQMFKSGKLPSGKHKRYKSYINKFSGWTKDNKEWVTSLVNIDWYDTYGVDTNGGSGYAAGSGMTAEEIADITGTYGDIDSARKKLCEDAMSFVGMIPYYWGGKAGAKDYAANNFNTAVTPDNKGRAKKGLDCSGFVQWIIWRVTDMKPGCSTSTITSGMKQISAKELQPGDLGLMAVPGTAINHVGIYVGCNKEGEALWCHENSSCGNVSVNNTSCFKLYYRMF